MNIKKQSFSLFALALLGVSLHLCADDGTAPTVSPSSEQKVEFKSGSETISFQASGGESAAADDSTAPCPPWVEDGAPEWEWDVSGGVESDGSTTTDTLKIKRSTAGKGAVKVRSKQKWKDSPPNGTAASSTSTYTPWSSSVDVMVIKVEFQALAAYGNPSVFDAIRFAGISPWAGSVKVTPQEATGLIQVKLEQWKNTKGGYVDTNGLPFTAATTSGQDSGYQVDTPTVSGDIINITGGDSPGFNAPWPYVQAASVYFHFNLYMRYQISDAGVSWKTIGKVFWKWEGFLVRKAGPINSPALPSDFTPSGGTTTATGSASTEGPQSPPAP